MSKKKNFEIVNSGDSRFRLLINRPRADLKGELGMADLDVEAGSPRRGKNLKMINSVSLANSTLADKALTVNFLTLRKYFLSMTTILKQKLRSLAFLSLKNIFLFSSRPNLDMLN